MSTTNVGKDVLLGFSGGIDSCASVGLLQSAGYRVIAVTLDTTGDQTLLDEARVKATQLGIEHIVDNVQEAFQTEIIDYFTGEYLRGRTPAPCTRCNRVVKWRRLDEISRERGIELLATGHYFKITEHNSLPYITRADDLIKDQSYYLWDVERTLLPRIITPMGDRIKSELKAGLSPAQSKESMGVCFLAGRDYRELIGAAGQIEQGKIVNRDGRVVGQHDGFPFYTIGQKRGLNLTEKHGGECVTEIDAARNILIVGTDADLHHHNLIIENCTVADLSELLTADNISVKVRGLGRNPNGFCKIKVAETKTTKTSISLHISLENPAWAAAVGQPVVLYRADRVVGGGFLEKYF